MAASTIPNSGGPGSSVELSPMTIAVRDKVIEKFADQPLDEMNESVKKLLSIEKDEQKRLGILAARVYILRQRIMNIAETDAERVVGSSSPTSDDLVLNSSDNLQDGAGNSEWTRLRILEDCEVNGVRFPSTVIIDVKSEDAMRLIESGKAEMIAEDPVSSSDMAADMDDTPSEEAVGEVEADAENAPVGMPEDEAAEQSTDEMSALSATLDSDAAPTDEAESAPEMAAEPMSAEAAPEATPAIAEELPADDAPETTASAEETETEAVIEAPSAAEVTAALEALSNGSDDSAPEAAAPEAVASEAAAPEASAPADPAPAEAVQADTAADSSEAESADVAAELEALSAAFSSPAAESNDEPAAGEGKPAGWFEAQQNAEKAAREDTSSDTSDEDGDAKS